MLERLHHRSIKRLQIVWCERRSRRLGVCKSGGGFRHIRARLPGRSRATACRSSHLGIHGYRNLLHQRQRWRMRVRPYRIQGRRPAAWLRTAAEIIPSRDCRTAATQSLHRNPDSRSRLPRKTKLSTARTSLVSTSRWRWFLPRASDFLPVSLPKMKADCAFIFRRVG